MFQYVDIGPSAMIKTFCGHSFLACYAHSTAMMSSLLMMYMVVSNFLVLIYNCMWSLWLYGIHINASKFRISYIMEVFPNQQFKFMKLCLAPPCDAVDDVVYTYITMKICLNSYLNNTFLSMIILYHLLWFLSTL